MFTSLVLRRLPAWRSISFAFPFPQRLHFLMVTSSGPILVEVRICVPAFFTKVAFIFMIPSTTDEYFFARGCWGMWSTSNDLLFCAPYSVCCPFLVCGTLSMCSTVRARVRATVVSEILETWHLGLILPFALANATSSVVVVPLYDSPPTIAR